MVKKLKDLNGPQVKERDSGVIMRMMPTHSNPNNFDLVTIGDRVFTVSLKTLTIDTSVVKHCTLGDQPQYMKICYSSPLENRDFKPFIFPSPQVGDGMKVCYVNGNACTSGNMSTTLDGAVKILEAINNKDCFYALDVGDAIYGVDGKTNEMKRFEVYGVNQIKDMVDYSRCAFFVELFLHTDGIRTILKVSQKAFSNSASRYSDIRLSTNFQFDTLHWFIHKKDAEEYVNKVKKAKEKLLKKKQDDKPKEGTELVLKDSRGATLHVGDEVAYICNDSKGGILSHRSVCRGIVVSESNKYITVFDDEERQRIRNRNKIFRLAYQASTRFNDTEKDGFSCVSSRSILFIKKWNER